MIRSWWRRVVAVLIVLLITAGSFFGWTTFNYSHQIQKTIETENSNSVALWINLTSSRLGTLYEHIYELLLTLYNNTELRVGTPIMNEWTKKAVVDMMEDKLLISGDADAFFVYDTQDEFFLFSAGSTQTVYQVLGMKEYARNYGVASAEAFRDQTWKIVPVEQNQYFFKSVQLGKYIVGAFSDLDKYQIDKDFSVLGEFISFELLIDDISYPCGSSGASEASRRSRNDILISREMSNSGWHGCFDGSHPFHSGPNRYGFHFPGGGQRPVRGAGCLFAADAAQGCGQTHEESDAGQPDSGSRQYRPSSGA